MNKKENTTYKEFLKSGGEKKWQEFWDKKKVFKTSEKNDKKYYILDMFPYPSGAGLHVGHPEGYTATDIVARYRRMKYKNEDVLHPMGFDAFGLPAENYAISQGVHPHESIEKNIERFREQLKSFGFSYDWEREVVTSRPEYYKWTQWMFRELYKKGLAYKKEAPVNWCESCQTVLAREQVVDGKCERCKNEVVQKNLSQWFFKITDYAEELLADIEKLDWPEPIKALQRNWIGKSVGATVKFEIRNSKFETNSKLKELNLKNELEVFTTRPDTLFGATFMVIAPEHPLIQNLESRILNLEEIKEYIKESQKKSELERTDLNKDKTGVKIDGLVAINPVNNQEIPIFIADYVMMNYGTGAIMAVPAHDERDYEFAKKYDLEIVEVIKGGDIEKEAFTEIEKGEMVNSEFMNGMKPNEAIKKMIEWLEEKKLGKKSIQYKLRDWLVSRQRYWGAPIPIIYCPMCGEVLVDEKELPVELPDDVDFKPTGESPLANSENFHKVKCPKCGIEDGVKREVDTMDTFVCSSWYFLRYCDSQNDSAPFDKEKIKKWMPVDLYVGGAEHAVMHLMYARFFAKALCDMGHVDIESREPFTKLRNQGMILAEDGRKMSKSLGNVINPDDVVAEYGADTFRMYEMFMGPLEDSKPWNTSSMAGVYRFLQRVFDLQSKINLDKEEVKENKEILVLLNKTIKKVGEDIENMRFNTAISAMMILVNEMEKNNQFSILNFKSLIKLLSPFAPHMCEEIWKNLGNKDSLIKEDWPSYDEKYLVEDEITLAVQVNGKVRDQITMAADISEEEVKEKVLASEKIQKWLDGKEPKKVIYIKGKLVSVVI